MPSIQASRRAWPALTLATLLIAACSAQSRTEPHQHRPQQAGQPLDPLKTAGHITAARLSALSGDQDGVRRNMEAMSEDMRSAMKIPDAARAIDREAARAATRTLPGVRSVLWLDRNNLLVQVEGHARRSQQTIDEVCYQLQPLGDTLAVVVHLQNAAARSADEIDTLSRNCQLAPGDRAFMHRDRPVNVLDPHMRVQYRATAERVAADAPRVHDAGDRAALEEIPEL